MKLIAQSSSCEHVYEARVTTSQGHKHDVGVTPRGRVTCTCGACRLDHICRHVDFVLCRALRMYDHMPSCQLDDAEMAQVMSHLDRLDRRRSSDSSSGSGGDGRESPIIPCLTPVASSMGGTPRDTLPCAATLRVGT